MQHLDEGTIHAWLDGALTTDEAVRAEAHVKDCAQCQASVAEARGFIAASSRILTALDNAPRGVIPKTAAGNRVQPWMWRIAATVLVVATGTIIVVRERGGENQNTTATRGMVALPQDNATAAEGATANAPVAVQTSPVQQDGVRAEREGTQNRAGNPLVRESQSAAAPAVSSQSPTATAQAAKPGRVSGVVEQDFSARSAERRADRDEQSVAATGALPVAPLPAAPLPIPPAAMRAPAFGAMDVAKATTPRELQRKRMVGRTQTFYEIAPGDTVILEEESSARLESVVATGAGAGAAADQRAQAQTERLSGKAAATETRQKTQAAAAAPPPVSALQDVQHPEIHRISWLDRATGNVLILSGRHSQEDLQAIRQRIQRLRDMEAQSKKTPQ